MAKMAEIYLLTGSNLNDREGSLSFAKEQLRASVGEICQESTIYETEPWGVADQPWYLNQALKMRTALTADELLKVTKQVELAAGRKEKSNLQPRVLDIDILFYENLVVNTGQLTLPHPRLHERKFSLVPLHEIARQWIHPVFGKTIDELLKECTDTLEVKKHKPCDTT